MDNRVLVSISKVLRSHDGASFLAGHFLVRRPTPMERLLCGSKPPAPRLLAWDNREFTPADLMCSTASMLQGGINSALPNHFLIGSDPSSATKYNAGDHCPLDHPVMVANTTLVPRSRIAPQLLLLVQTAIFRMIMATLQTQRPHIVSYLKELVPIQLPLTACIDSVNSDWFECKPAGNVPAL